MIDDDDDDGADVDDDGDDDDDDDDGHHDGHHDHHIPSRSIIFHHTPSYSHVVGYCWRTNFLALQGPQEDICDGRTSDSTMSFSTECCWINMDKLIGA